MAIGDQRDLVHRLYRWLPTRWFPTEPGTLINAILSGWAAAFQGAYAAIQYAALQIRIATATDGFLDIIANDYFGNRLLRLTNELDPAFSARIRREILRERVTREAIDRVVYDATGNHPSIIELNRTSDIGCWRQGFAYGTGCYGSFGRPYEIFITTARTNPSNFPLIGGWRGPQMAYRGPDTAWTLPSIFPPPQRTDAAINAALESVRPAGVKFWLQLTG